MSGWPGKIAALSKTSFYRRKGRCEHHPKGVDCSRSFCTKNVVRLDQFGRRGELSQSITSPQNGFLIFCISSDDFSLTCIAQSVPATVPNKKSEYGVVCGRIRSTFCTAKPAVRTSRSRTTAAERLQQNDCSRTACNLNLSEAHARPPLRTAGSVQQPKAKPNDGSDGKDDNDSDRAIRKSRNTKRKKIFRQWSSPPIQPHLRAHKSIALAP